MARMPRAFVLLGLLVLCSCSSGCAAWRRFCETTDQECAQDALFSTVGEISSALPTIDFERPKNTPIPTDEQRRFGLCAAGAGVTPFDRVG